MQNFQASHYFLLTFLPAISLSFLSFPFLSFPSFSENFLRSSQVQGYQEERHFFQDEIQGQRFSNQADRQYQAYRDEDP